ncbi:PREDICTED: zinc finger protein 777-like [Ficedula albicollis]|uniref:zinc finger protein 777-like n=1 Tax=Ficedula albicollis TaxID=59894 RepID=UPI0007AD8DBC|nr:PREDICTED: zinc finger protein 777-like [Ficedula albicollis]
MYRSVMEGNYEMLVSLYCALYKPELLLQLEREELSTPPESEPEAAEVSPELTVELALQNSTSDDTLLETEAMERGCREPEESRNVAEKSESLAEESKNLAEESRSLVEISGNLAEESKNLVEENRSPMEISGNLAEESKNLVEENRSPMEISGNLAEESKNLVEENRSPMEISGNLAEESKNLVEENRSPMEISGNLAEESKNLVEENRSPMEISGNLAEESKNLVEENRSPMEISGNLAEESKNLVEENRSPAEENRSPAKESRSPAEESGNLMEECRSPVFPENCSTPPIPLEGFAVLADLSQPTPSLPCLLFVSCQEAEGQNSSPPAAGDAEVGIPREVLQEEVAAEKPSMPKTPSKGPGEDNGPEEEAVKDSGNTGQDLVADIPEEPGKEVTPDVHRQTEQADPSPGELQKDSCMGRPAALQRNSARQFYSCPICRKTFLLKINLLIHERSHANWVPYVCVHCDRKFMSKKKIKRHLRAWAANGTCQPSEPGQVPCSASHPQTWAANGTCQASKPEKCPSRTPCPTSQPQTWAPNGTCQPSDVKACPSQGPCPTSQCPTSQPQNWAPSGSCQPLDAKVCPSQGPFPTSQCPTSQCSLSSGKMMYTCNECLETFSNQIFLTVHQRRHSGHHLILCPCCNRSFTWVTDFVRQHWKHMGVRPHQCGICQKTFKRFSHLKEHQRIHRRQERPFSCATPVPVVAAPAAGDEGRSQDVTPQGGDPAAGSAVGP